jgi:hypothetical protein
MQVTAWKKNQQQHQNKLFASAVRLCRLQGKLFGALKLLDVEKFSYGVMPQNDS